MVTESCGLMMDGGGVLGTPMKEALDTLFEVRADTSVEGAADRDSNTLPGICREKATIACPS